MEEKSKEFVEKGEGLRERVMPRHYSEIKIAGGDTSMPLSLAKRISLISQVCNLSEVRLLDCGCGTGDYVFALRERYKADAWGVEYLEDKVIKAKANPLHGDRIKQGDIQELDEPDSSFDVVLLNEVLEHVPDDRKALREVHRILKCGGQAIVFSPNRLFPFESHGVQLRHPKRYLSPAIPCISYVPLALGNLFWKYWARNYWPHELRRLIREAGFVIQMCAYVWQTFENISTGQPVLIRKFRPLFRKTAEILEHTPVLRQFGLSQAIVAKKV